MKVIQAAGGPLICLDQQSVRLWSANVGKTFIGKDSRFADDYDALGYLPDGTLMPPWSIMLFRGILAEALVISMPFETAIVRSSSNSIFLAQVEFANPEWSFARVKMGDFEATTFGEEVRFESSNATYLLFDSAYKFDEVEDEFLQFALDKGEYTFSSGFCRPDDQTSLLLYRIIPAS